MTSISLSTAGFPARTRLRLTRRGRRVLATLAAVPAAVVLCAAVASGGAAIAGIDDGVPSGSFETVTVSYGDSLWSIAEEIAPMNDPRDVVDDLARLNALPDGTIVVGQKLSIPAEYSADGR